MKRVFISLFCFSILIFLLSLSCNFFKDVCTPLVGNNYIYTATLALHLGLFSFALFFLWKGSLRSTLDALGVPGKPMTTIKYAVAGLAALFAILLILGITTTLLGFNDQSKVHEKVDSLPLLLLVFAVVVAPITEELFFRGLIATRFGIVPSAVLFSLAHFTYGSVSEIAGTLAIGLLLGWIVRRTNSIAPGMLIHLTYNLISVIVIRFFL